MFENSLLRSILEPKLSKVKEEGDWKLHKKELHNLDSSPNTIMA